MVGRFVEQEQVGLHDEQPREVRAHDPAAAHFARGPLVIAGLVTQPGEHLLGLRLDLWVIKRLVLGVGFEVGGAGNVAGRFEFLQAGFELRHLAPFAGGEIKDGFAAGGFAFLWQVADHRPLVALDGPGVGRLVAEDDGKERRLARAVGADQRDALAVVDLHGGVFKKGPAADGFLEIADREHGFGKARSIACLSLCVRQRRASRKVRQAAKEEKKVQEDFCHPSFPPLCDLADFA